MRLTLISAQTLDVLNDLGKLLIPIAVEDIKVPPLLGCRVGNILRVNRDGIWRNRVIGLFIQGIVATTCSKDTETMELAGRSIVQLMEPFSHLCVGVCAGRAIAKDLWRLYLEKEDRCPISLDNEGNNEIDGILVSLSDWNLVLGANGETLVDVEELDEDAIPWTIVYVFVRIRANIEKVCFYNVRKHGDDTDRRCGDCQGLIYSHNL